MKKWRKAIFNVAYSIDEKGLPEYLLLKRKWHWIGWEFPKGKVEPREDLTETAMRELKEETGIDVDSRNKVYDHKVRGKYLYPRKIPDRPEVIGQTYHLFSTEVQKPDGVKLDCLEHNGHRWMNFEKAMKLLTHGTQRKCLRIVNKYITTNNKN